MELKTKKKIAREVLILFMTIVLSGLFYVGNLGWNLYFEKSTNRLEKKVKSIQSVIDSIPQDHIGNLYKNGLRDILVVNYQVGNDKYAIPKKEEKEFLKDFPDAVRLENHSLRYSYFKIQSVDLQDTIIKFRTKEELGIKMKKISPVYSIHPNDYLANRVLKKYPVQYDSTIVFDFVELDEFRNLMRDKVYRDKFFRFATIEFDIEVQREYYRNVYEGLQYNDSIDAKTKQLNFELNGTKRQIRDNKNRIVGRADISENTLIFWFIMLGLLYPIRLMFIALKWSIGTIKK